MGIRIRTYARARARAPVFTRAFLLHDRRGLQYLTSVAEGISIEISSCINFRAVGSSEPVGRDPALPDSAESPPRICRGSVKSLLSPTAGLPQTLPPAPLSARVPPTPKPTRSHVLCFLPVPAVRIAVPRKSARRKARPFFPADGGPPRPHPRAPLPGREQGGRHILRAGRCGQRHAVLLGQLVVRGKEGKGGGGIEY